MSTLDSCVKDYPPDEHILSHESNPLAAGVSVVKQKIKDDASQSNSKPSQIVNNAVSSTNVLTGPTCWYTEGSQADYPCQ